MNSLILLIILVPIVEIYLFIKIGSQIGAISTILLIISTAIIGVYYARIQGIQTLKSGITNIYQNKAPIYELMSGASIACAALMLIIPGFLTDGIGFILLFPFSRKILLRIIFRKGKKTNETRKNIETIDGEIINKDKDDL